MFDQTKMRQILESSIYAWKKREPNLDLSKNPLTNERYIELKEKMLKEFGDKAIYVKRANLEKDVRKFVSQKKFEEKVVSNQIRVKDRYREQRIMHSLSKVRHELENISHELEEVSRELDRL